MSNAGSVHARPRRRPTRGPPTAKIPPPIPLKSLIALGRPRGTTSPDDARPARLRPTGRFVSARKGSVDSMDQTISARIQRRRKRRGILALLAALSTLSLGAGAFSLALFTDSANATGAFTTGTIDIAVRPPALVPVRGG